MSTLSCNQAIPDHIEQDCDDYPKGGSPSLAVFYGNHGITDFSSASEWQTAINAGNARIINKIKLNMPEPSEVLVDNPVACGADQKLDGFDYEVQWIDANVNVYNDDFYKKLNVNTMGLAFYNCDTNTLRVFDKNLTFSARPMFPASHKEHQSYNVTARVSTSADYFPTLVNAPTGIFGTGS